jgi:hypothetical protein
MLKFLLAARKETYARFMQSKDETNTDVLEEVRWDAMIKRSRC